MDKEMQLFSIKKEIDSKARFWNQNSLFLSFGFISALFLTVSIELFKIIGRDYSFKWKEIYSVLFNNNKIDYYFWGIITFWVFGLVLSVLIANIIDNHTKHYNALSKGINQMVKVK
ncbi:MAG: hypothetical protein AABW81_01780 [Nanoarchaeota archaeon]